MSEHQFRVPWIADLDGTIPTVYVHEMQHPNQCAGETCIGASLENFDIDEKVDGYTESELIDLIDLLKTALEHIETVSINDMQMRLFLQ